MKIRVSIAAPIRKSQDFDIRWNGKDCGLITAWERGREKAVEDLILANKVKNGELVILPWKGGLEKTIKTKAKYGTYHYLAMWQGIYGMDLEIDSSIEVIKTCSRTGVTVIFTSDISKYNQPYSE